MIVLAVFTDGRKDYIERTLDSFAAQVTGPITRRLIFDDSADPEYREWLIERFPGYDVLSVGQRRGFGGTIARAWETLAGNPERFVFHLEDDFTFNRPVDLTRLAYVLDELPDIIQIALLRQPWNAIERELGGVIPAGRARGIDFQPVKLYDQGVAYDQWIEHRGWFTTNPTLYPTALCALGWPKEPESEGKFGLRLTADAELRFAYRGDGTPWVEHIGRERGRDGVLMTDREQEAIERIGGVLDSVTGGRWRGRKLSLVAILDALTLPRSVPCPTCGGTGNRKPEWGEYPVAGFEERCKKCNGTGSVSVPPLLVWRDAVADAYMRGYADADNGQDPEEQWNEEA